MSDLLEMDVEVKLAAYGAWVNDNPDSLGCKSPSLMLMKSAPYICKGDLKPPKRSQVTFISDDDALAVDKVMKGLRTYSLLLWRIVVWHYIRGNSERAITEHLNATEAMKFTRIKVKNLLERAHGFIEKGVLDVAAST